MALTNKNNDNRTILLTGKNQPELGNQQNKLESKQRMK